MMAGFTPKHVNKRLAAIYKVVSFKQDFSIEVLLSDQQQEEHSSTISAQT